ncbi:hypothetical protein CCHR01_15922 [Colletotrichum chrysophilum]|uniref:Uncharacterized protein n=1 Tax=Colletotrichum chrysophilum TaxID=1836956 RepID=A0AAD9A4P6_9PEZI|nr:hypothetical protein CCHR01_15922 [Colletotrichum chrysophilum]
MLGSTNHWRVHPPSSQRHENHIYDITSPNPATVHTINVRRMIHTPRRCSLPPIHAYHQALSLGVMRPAKTGVSGFHDAPRDPGDTTTPASDHSPACQGGCLRCAATAATTAAAAAAAAPAPLAYRSPIRRASGCNPRRSWSAVRAHQRWRGREGGGEKRAERV